AWVLRITDPAQLAGLPEGIRALARAAAEAKGEAGWRFTLHAPSYQPFMQYAEDRELRRRMYTAFVNRASEPPHDNRPVILRILELRRELVGLLGYPDFADYRLQENMAGSGERALAFLDDLTGRTRPLWEREIGALEHFAAKALGIRRLEPWDTAWAAERLRRARFDLDEEELRPFFPLPRVLEGLWEIAGRLFGVRVSERTIDQVWHPEVRFFDLHDEAGVHLGSFYTDWFPRETKRGGAWMNSLITGGPRGAGWEPHLGLVVGNFTPPEGGRPALLTHREVQTVFHEFGHLLHHLLSRVEVAARAGTNVPRDWVELPSQLLENWTWERPALDLFARHWETGEPLPEALYEKMLAARRFMAASFQMRQLSLGTLDLHLHMRYDPERDGDVVAYSQALMARFAIRPEFARNHFVSAFTHVFTGGYAAAYYSYLWSETLDADAFGRFEREGIFSRDTGQAYVDAILSRGDSADPAELFREFMGRDPDPEALLRRNLGATEEEATLSA
ncbi:MAG: M3 family metallopeptidase, partial [Gemmatimonadota bacterium]|nr:M3 family metallopeptidase [Gemmatimonadota bacterium]